LNIQEHVRRTRISFEDGSVLPYVRELDPLARVERRVDAMLAEAKAKREAEAESAWGLVPRSGRVVEYAKRALVPPLALAALAVALKHLGVGGRIVPNYEHAVLRIEHQNVARFYRPFERYADATVHVERTVVRQRAERIEREVLPVHLKTILVAKGARNHD
jgi:hypothetical protein